MIRYGLLARLGSIVVALALTGGAMAGQSSESPPRPALITVPYAQFTLPNGLHVILHEDHRLPMVTVSLVFRVGSANERPGQADLAHLFEHLSYEGSAHVPEGEADRTIEGVGGNANASTWNDDTRYWVTVPSNALELALFFESDRIGYLLDAMTPEFIDRQRDVVKNEFRESYQNAPYGMASLVLNEMLYPEGHPYHHKASGYLEDLTRLSTDDVKAFFQKYYGPNNASMTISGDIEPSETKRLVEKWFSDVRRGPDVQPLVAAPPTLSEVKRQTIRDQVQLPRLYLAWPSPPLFRPGDAALDLVGEVLAGGKNSRLYRRLVYDTRIAQSVRASQGSSALASSFVVVATAAPGHTVEELQRAIDEEMDKLRQTAPSQRELDRAVNGIEAAYYFSLERSSGIAEQLNQYYNQTGDPDYFAEDLARYRSASPSDIQAAVEYFLPANARVELIVLPEEATERRP